MVTHAESQPETQPQVQPGRVASTASEGAPSTAAGSLGMVSSGAIGNGQFELASFVVGDEELEVSSTTR
jgi:hypothetical protein